MKLFHHHNAAAYIKQYQREDAQAASFVRGIRNYPDVNPLKLDSVIKTDLVTLVKSHIPFKQKWDTLQFVANRMEDPADVFKLVIAYMDRKRDAYGVEHIDLNVPVQFSDPAYIKRNYIKEPQPGDAQLALLETAFARLPEIDLEHQYDAARIISNHAPLRGDLQRRSALFVWQNVKHLHKDQANAVLNEILKYPGSPRGDIGVYDGLPALCFTFGGSAWDERKVAYGALRFEPVQAPTQTAGKIRGGNLTLV